MAAPASRLWKPASSAAGASGCSEAAGASKAQAHTQTHTHTHTQSYQHGRSVHRLPRGLFGGATGLVVFSGAGFLVLVQGLSGSIARTGRSRGRARVRTCMIYLCKSQSVLLSRVSMSIVISSSESASSKSRILLPDYTTTRGD